MSGAQWREQFARAGFGDDDGASRTALVGSAERGFVDVVGRQPSWRWFVPGRLEVFGKHTDYAGGRSLVAAVPRGVAVVAAARGDDHVRVVDAADGEAADVDVATADARLTGWRTYVAVVARRFAANFPGAALGVDLTFCSDLPRAAGLSSSSVLVTAVATALVRRGSLDERPEWRRVIRSAHDLAWYLGCVESGRDYPGLPGSAGVGTLGGSEDHTAILTCRAHHVSLNRYIPVTPLGEIAMPPDWTFVVATSGVRADKGGAVRERYNRLSLAADRLRSLWNAAADRTPAASVAAALGTGADAEREILTLVERSADAIFSRDELSRRLAHFIREDARVLEAARSIGAADAAKLGELASASQRDADELLRNQVPETRVLVETARGAGAWAASSFGAGFGGSVWAVISTAETDRLARDWLAAYRDRCPHAVDAQWFAARPAPALVEITGAAGR